MSDNLKFWLWVTLVAAAILAIGWNQPLRYRLMSQAEIYELEHPAPPENLATPTPKPWMWDSSRKTPLDQGNYNPNGYSGRGSSSAGTQTSRAPFSR